MRIMQRTYRLTRGWSNAGFDLLKPMADELEPLMRLWARAHRRHLIRKYLTGADMDPIEIVYVDKQLSVEGDPDLQEDFERVRAAILNPGMKLYADLRAKITTRAW
jgi:hypothetical protein